jgi:cell division protein FtsQ
MRAEPRESRLGGFELPRLDWPRLGSALALIGGLFVLFTALSRALDRPVMRVVVEGPFQRVSVPDVEAVTAPFMRSGFLSIDLDAVRHAVEELAWVDRARVERSWPDALHIVVAEQVPAARWGDAGLLNTRGEMFLRQARHVPPELPRLDGPDGTEQDVARLYLDTYPRLLGVGMRLARVTLDARGALDLELANGVEVRIGRQDVAARLERFIKVASPLVATRQGDIAYVDMRYSNGFSVGWSSRVAATRKQDQVPDA